MLVAQWWVPAVVGQSAGLTVDLLEQHSLQGVAAEVVTTMAACAVAPGVVVVDEMEAEDRISRPVMPWGCSWLAEYHFAS